MAARGRLRPSRSTRRPEPLGAADHSRPPALLLGSPSCGGNGLGLSGRSMHVGRRLTLPKICSDAPFMANLTWGASRTSGTMLSWLFSGRVSALPEPEDRSSEGEVGWMPYFRRTRAEQVLDKQRYWVKRGTTFMVTPVTGRPRHARHPGNLPRSRLRLFHRGPPRVKSLAELGEDNIMCETDYPHSDSTWPDCIGVARNVIKDLPENVQYKLLRGNAERLYRYTPGRAGRLGVPNERSLSP